MHWFAARLFFLAVLGLLALGLWQRFGPVSYAEACQELVDGDPDRRERERLLAAVLEQGVALAEPLAAARAAAAALILGDEAGFEAAMAAVVPRATLLPDGTVALPGDAAAEASLGVGWVRQWFEGNAAAQAGDPNAAAVLFARAEAGLRLAGDRVGSGRIEGRRALGMRLIRAARERNGQ